MPLARCRSSTLPKARDVALTFDRPQPTQVFFALSGAPNFQHTPIFYPPPVPPSAWYKPGGRS